MSGGLINGNVIWVVKSCWQ